MKIQVSSNKLVGALRFNDTITLSSDQDFLPRQGPLSKAYDGATGAIGWSSVAYTDNSFAEGEATQAGTRSFRVVSGDMAASTWTLKTTRGIRPGYMYTVRLLNNYDMAGSVVSVLDDHTISVDGFPTPRRISERLSDPYLSA